MRRSPNHDNPRVASVPGDHQDLKIRGLTQESEEFAVVVWVEVPTRVNEAVISRWRYVVQWLGTSSRAVGQTSVDLSWAEIAREIEYDRLQVGL